MSRDFSHERLYLGSMTSRGQAVRASGHQWNNDAFYIRTALQSYPTCALAGGYVVSGDVVELPVLMKVPRQILCPTLRHLLRPSGPILLPHPAAPGGAQPGHVSDASSDTLMLPVVKLKV